jgi:hypothetical protein
MDKPEKLRKQMVISSLELSEVLSRSLDYDYEVFLKILSIMNIWSLCMYSALHSPDEFEDWKKNCYKDFKEDIKTVAHIIKGNHGI